MSTVLFGTASMIYERPIQEDYEYKINPIWQMFVTMSTVGYGDIVPKSHLGRLITGLACIWGMFLLSLLMVTLNELINFDENEDLSFKFLNLLSKKGTLEDSAFQMICSWMTYHFLKRKVQRKPELKEEYDQGYFLDLRIKLQASKRRFKTAKE